MLSYVLKTDHIGEIVADILAWSTCHCSYKRALRCLIINYQVYFNVGSFGHVRFSIYRIILKLAFCLEPLYIVCYSWTVYGQMEE